MNLFYALFILTFIVVYGSLSLALLGSWAYAKARSIGGIRRPSTDELGG